MSNNVFKLAERCFRRTISDARTIDWSGRSIEYKRYSIARELRTRFSEQNLPMDLCDEFIADRISDEALWMLNQPFPPTFPEVSEVVYEKMRPEMVGA